MFLVILSDLVPVFIDWKRCSRLVGIRVASAHDAKRGYEIVRALERSMIDSSLIAQRECEMRQRSRWERCLKSELDEYSAKTFHSLDTLLTLARTITAFAFHVMLCRNRR